MHQTTVLFSQINRLLCQKQHERVFANMLHGLLDRFKADRPVARTLSAFLLLISALLADPIFAEEALLAASGTEGAENSTATTTELSERQMRISTLRLGHLLSGRKSENLINAVTTRLEVSLIWI